jgi:hypothetical protein
MPRRPLRSRDWLFGSDTKRQLLAVLTGDPGAAWTKAALAKKVGVHPKGGLDEHLRALREMEVAQESDGLWSLDPAHALIGPLKRVLAVVETLPDRPLKP